MATALEQWVDEVARHTHPKDIYWCDGSEVENQRLIREMLAARTLSELNQTGTRTATSTAATRATSRAPST